MREYARRLSIFVVALAGVAETACLTTETVDPAMIAWEPSSAPPRDASAAERLLSSAGGASRFGSPPEVPPREMSIEDAAMLALRNNRDLQVQSYGPVIAGTFERIERGTFGTEVFGSANALQENVTQTARATGEQFDVEGRSTQLRAGVRQRIATGTDVEAAVEHRYDESDRTPEQQEARVGLTVTQALLRGFGPAANLAAVTQAQLEAEASRYELAAFTQSILAQTELAYWAYVLAEEEIEIFERSLEVVRRELTEVEARIEVGELPELEVAPVQAQVALREQALIEARSRLESSRLQLHRLVNPSEAGALDGVIIATSEPKLDLRPLEDRSARVELALAYRPELEEAELRRRQDRLETVVTRNGVLPRLDVFVAFNKTGFDDSFSGSFGALGSPTYDIRAGLDFSQVVTRQAARALDVQARATERQSAAAIENLRQLVRLEVRLAINEVERARAQVGASAATRAFQERTVQAEKERFRVGASTSLSVARAQRDLLQSEIAEVRAVVDYRSALVRLYSAEGTLLARRGVSIR